MTTTTKPDIRDLLSTAIDQGATVLAGVRPDQYGDPTPCKEMTVRQLMDHFVGVAERITVLGETGDYGSSHAFPALDEWSMSYARHVAAARKAWADPAKLNGTIKLPWTEMPGARALAMYVSELTVHSWDLATATGQRGIQWDPDVVATSLEAMHAELPADWRDEFVPFDPVVEVPSGAPAIDRLVAWTGRQPRARTDNRP